jgi:hypothetical protein
MAGFTNSIAGVWTYVDIRVGDFVSFLYSARAFNLYEVIGKEAIDEYWQMPPWEPLTFRESGRRYHFPFRLYLKPLREFSESLVRPEFAYVAENLLLRAGYRKTHFQADQTTLQNVSQMGALWNGVVQPLELPEHKNFEPRFTITRQQKNIPYVCPFQDLILQAVIRHYLSERKNLTNFLTMIGLDNLNADDSEVLGEKALSEGHVDILIKDRVPIVQARKIAIKVKLHKAQRNELMQLRKYMNELGEECLLGVLIAESFPRRFINEAEKYNIRLVRYKLSLNWESPRGFNEILNSISLHLENLQT